MSVAALVPGSLFAERYEIVQCIDFGGMGAIYEVIHLQTRRRRALKLMLPDVVENEDLRRRFKLEATVAAEVESEHIVETFDAGVDAATGAPFLVMELLRGATLKALLQRLDRLHPPSALDMLTQVAMGLDKTHAAGIVHRDLKPDNLFLVQRDDGQIRVKILDFGIAKVVAGVTHPSKTKVMGTPLYMAPEQLSGDGRIGPPADLYALAHLAFTMLTGTPYWQPEADSSESIFNFLLTVMEGTPEAPSARARSLGVDLVPGFDPWFSSGTARDPDARPATATAQIAALRDLYGPMSFKPGQTLVDAFEDAVGERDSRRGRTAASTAVRDAVRGAEARPPDPLSTDALAGAGREVGYHTTTVDPEPGTGTGSGAAVSVSDAGTSGSSRPGTGPYDAGATHVGISIPKEPARTKQALWVGLGALLVVGGAAAVGAFSDEPGSTGGPGVTPATEVDAEASGPEASANPPVDAPSSPAEPASSTSSPAPVASAAGDANATLAPPTTPPVPAATPPVATQGKVVPRRTAPRGTAPRGTAPRGSSTGGSAQPPMPASPEPPVPTPPAPEPAVDPLKIR
ncbi:MAG: protein kinase [Myxococcota bacterium]